MIEGIGDTFQKDTKYARGRVPGGALNWTNRAKPYKEYPSSRKIELVPPGNVETLPLKACLEKRKSVRDF
jgi:hypothetical protein